MTEEIMNQAKAVNNLMKDVNQIEERVSVSREHLNILESELELKRKLFKREERVYIEMIKEFPFEGETK